MAPLSSLFSNVVALSLLAAALWGISDFLGGLAARRATSVLTVAVAHGVSLTFLVLLALALRARVPGQSTAIWALITGLSGGAAVLAFYRALAIGEMGLIAALAGVLTAVVPVAISWSLEGRPGRPQALGFLCAAVAIFLIGYEPKGRPQARGLGLAIFAGLGFGLFLVASKFASQGAVLWPLALSRLVSASLAVAILFGAPRRGSKKPPERSGKKDQIQATRGFLILAGSAGLLESVGNLSYMLSTLSGRLDVAAVISSLYPAATILLALWLLREKLSISKAIGIALALFAVVLIAL